MVKATAERVIELSIDDVWDYVSTIENMSAWVEGVTDVSGPGEGELEVGARFESQYTYRGETFDVEYEVTAFEPPTRLDIASRAGPFPFSGSLRLSDLDGHTRVSNTIDAASDGVATTVIFTFFGPVVRRLMRRQLAGELDELDRVIGAQVSAEATGTGRPSPGRQD